ncbi:MAG: alpha/beta fold hydrolase [Actinomycetota bacterium]
MAALFGALVLLMAVGIGPMRADAAPEFDVDVHNDIEYYEPDTPTDNGNKLDLYVPEVPGNRTLPLVIWSSGSAWLSDDGKAGAAPIAEVFNQQGYAVAGVSVRSSSQTTFPGQLHDVRAAVRWLREHAADYNLDPDRFAIMGNSSGGWVSAIAGTTSDIAQLPGEPDVNGVSSAVQAAVPFFPPTDFLQMDAWYDDHPEVPSAITHDAPLSPLPPPWSFINASPESLLVGCTDADGNLLGIQSCPDKTQAANPISYIDGDEVPMLILHGESDPLVPNGQSVLLYEALTAAGNEATFVSVPAAGHSVDQIIGADEFSVFRTNRGGQEKITDEPAPTWENVEHFIHVSLSRARGR